MTPVHMDKKVYTKILVYNAIPGGKKLLGKKFVFLEDNDPKHSSICCQNYLSKKKKDRKQGNEQTNPWNLNIFDILIHLICLNLSVPRRLTE